MGHRFSKSASISQNGMRDTSFHSNDNAVSAAPYNVNIAIAPVAVEQTIPLSRPTINLEIQESQNPTTFNNQLSTSASNSSSLTSVNNSSSCPRQIIIKIQLAKMENGNGNEQQSLDIKEKFSDSNLNPIDANAQIFNVELTSNTIRTAGSSETTSNSPNSNINFNRNEHSTWMGRIQALQLGDELEPMTRRMTESVEYCEVIEEASGSEQNIESEEHVCTKERDKDNNCCRRRSSKPSKQRRCCKCTCRDAIRRILEPSNSTKVHKRKDSKQLSNSNNEHNQTPPNNSKQNSNLTTAVLTAASTSTGALQQNKLSIWDPSNIDSVIIPINSPQFVVLQCPPTTSVVTLGQIDNKAICLNMTTTADISRNHNGEGDINSNGKTTTVKSSSANGPIVHSQVDFRHFLVPDLEKITNSSFYWGKMDRYEAEKLLEGKPEGTFLLRDSAQEEFLFSVTFRKYGRSLHARIEQSGHKFSFDCHDPCVFTASTVTGLLQHYKDPACVMFFEPMLTIPLHRKTTFSLQKLCRSSIVSNTTYDGINALELPTRLKSYLKEYHYKQKLRVKPLDVHFDEPHYTCK